MSNMLEVLTILPACGGLPAILLGPVDDVSSSLTWLDVAPSSVATLWPWSFSLHPLSGARQLSPPRALVRPKVVMSCSKPVNLASAGLHSSFSFMQRALAARGLSCLPPKSPSLASRRAPLFPTSWRFFSIRCFAGVGGWNRSFKESRYAACIILLSTLALPLVPKKPRCIPFACDESSACGLTTSHEETNELASPFVLTAGCLNDPARPPECPISPRQ
mmetsp:Transcript_2283/g.8162  ORF Transcript_2283/g.8162 Transcript_2283/m.8162 type:complete len:219 (-) Transcript_2283:2214-2870(-)|eukprot:scaffold870_cov393-Prasinococcus_capsulatus_cf.AAC.8